jgi:2-polyprenyl-3-methyl-5-hydroxy-6-metoxy-1,4-benzoquinol methylase
MLQGNSYVAVDSYRTKAAQQETAVWNYKGLEMIASPQIHEYVSACVCANVPKGAAVLDLGSGSGAMCLRLLDDGFLPTGCDLVSENFRLHGQVEFHLANLNESFPAALQGKFDCVIGTELIEHLENPRHLIRECYKALKPGGMLILATPNIESSISIAQFIRSGEFRWFAYENYRREGHIMPVPASTMKLAFREAGFDDPTLQSISPMSFSGLSWWRMRALAALIRAVPGRSKQQGDVLVAWARKPDRAAK